MNLLRIEQRIIVAAEPVGVPVYDFDFDLHFRCDHPHRFEQREALILRIGPVPDYAALHAEFAELGLDLINSPNEHQRSSELSVWYPLIHDLTPRSVIYEDLPEAAEIAATFGWPVFVKGSRQTSKHKASLSVARNVAEYDALRETYRNDPILHWQQPVVREFVELDPIDGRLPHKVPAAREFRTFWWRGKLAGCGPYWYQLAPYSAADLNEGLALAKEAAIRVEVPFLVVDIARKRDGKWTIIELNDAQEAGYAGIAPQLLWRNILDLI